jgi:hypothetical protein
VLVVVFCATTQFLLIPSLVMTFDAVAEIVVVELVTQIPCA